MSEPAAFAPEDEFTDAQIEEPIVVVEGMIDHTGGRLVTPDGAVAVEWAPNPARPPTPAKVWSIIAPSGAGFQVSGPAGPGKMTCWPPGSERSPGTAGVGDPVKAAPPPPSPAAGVEILGPDQEWTTTKSTLNRDGSRTIEFIDERKPLRKKGLVKSSSGPYVLVPEKAAVLRRKSVGLRVLDRKKQQQEWKDAVTGDTYWPIVPAKKANEPPPAAKTPGAKSGSPPASADEDDLAPISKTPAKSAPASDPALDELAPISKTPSAPAPKKP